MGEDVAAVASTKGAPVDAGKWIWLVGFLLCLPPILCSLPFWPCVTYSEWYIDELFAVLRNADARGETPLLELLVHDFWGNPLRGGTGSWTHKSYRPLCVLSFTWQFQLLGGELFRPQPLRTFNVALHTANVVLVLLLLRSGLRFSRCWSCLAACLFAAHPVHTENVVYLVGRADMLATTGWLLAACSYLQVLNARREGRRRPGLAATGLLLVLCSLLAVLAGLCKESGFTLLVFLAGVELCTPQSTGWAHVGRAAAALALFGGLTYLRFQVTQGAVASFGYVDTPVQYTTDVAARSWTYLYQHAYYARLLLLPGHLSWDYSFDALPVLRETWQDVRSLGVLCAYLALLALVTWGLGRSRRRLILGLQHVLIPFVPASNLFFIVGVTVGERLLYPSTVGAAIAAAALGQSLERKRGPSSKVCRRWPLLVGLALLAVYCWKCYSRVWEWRSSEALYAADAAAWPRSVKTRHQLGTVYHAQSRYEEALHHYNASLALLDDNALTDHCIAQVYIETGRYKEALARFEKIMQGHGVGFSAFNLWMLYVDYGFTLVALGQYEAAVQPLEFGLQKNTAVPHGLNALGYAFASLQRLQDAQDTFAKGLEYDPENALLWNNLAVVWMVAGVLQQAVQGLQKALEFEPEHPVIIQNAVLLRDAAHNGGYINGLPRMELFFSRAT